MLSVLRSIDTRLGGVEARLGGVETRLGGVESRLDTLESTTARQPHLRLIGHQMATLIERVTALEASNTRAIAALNNVAREGATPSEVEALHAEVTELRTSKFNHEVGLRQLEVELHTGIREGPSPRNCLTDYVAPSFTLVLGILHNSLHRANWLSRRSVYGSMRARLERGFQRHEQEH